MIKYALACEQAHEFESWFPSSEAFEAQRKRGFVTCPFCDSAKVEKQIMAPSVARTDKALTAPAPEAQPVAILSEKERELRAALRALREHVMKNAEDVGKGFVEEARKMHHGETEERSIYGEADLAEARALLDEGIDVLPLPVVPDDRN
ncbi:hypothetical protein BB934_14735 [Microvirga ossetica]|uniref:DUF1178 domain-containing protein n=1 Tax=Microvirga ossetica TaxID=1882682 RepID=A0A1B2EH72_9HYPH|nr:DUF1178 family protein [Microvirga ossetica]ANY79320.1 hypothetical protein BB934_14735 [Microvirga ossetica]